MGLDVENAETLLISFIPLLLLALVISAAIFVHIRQKRGLSGTPLKNPFLEKVRIGLNRTGMVVSVIFTVWFVGAVIYGIASGLWDGVISSGFVSHTERVITDMNPQWLKGEQNSCVYAKTPTEDIAYMNCGTGEKMRNLPVKFYGVTVAEKKAEKPVMSEWKCERDGDTFSCSDSKPLKNQQ